jgi:1-acyl-sn-glycerol-3-phosphate acyltransferase
MLVLRSLTFNILFYLNMVLFMFGCIWAFLGPARWSVRCMQVWAQASLWLLRVVAGIHMRVEGAEHLPKGPVLVAGKHQSLWETFAIMPLLDNPCIVLKRELTLIPFFGWYAGKARMIGVERSAGASALKSLVAKAKLEIAEGRQIVILPEGTRKAPGDPPDYKPGAAALYSALDVPCVPFGLNAGLYWPRRKFLRHPGTITIAFCPPIPAGLPRREFQARMQEAIETTTNRLVAVPPT